MGDLRFDGVYERLVEAASPAEELRALDDGELIAALAAASRASDPYLANVLATEAQNRAARANAIVNTLEEGVFTVDREGRATFLNSPGEELLGWDRASFVGKEAHALVHPTCPRRGDGCFCALSEALESGGTHRQHEDVFHGSDGAPREVASTATALMKDGDVTGALIVFRDLSPLKSVMDSLRRHAALIELAPVAVLVWSPDGRLHAWSKGAEELYGWSTAEVIGRQVHEVLETAFPYPLPEIERELHEDGTWEGELVHRARGGRRVTVESRWALEAHGGVRAGRILQLDTDVTKRKRAERRLWESERRFRSAFDHAAIGMALVSPEGRWLMVNESLCDLVGYSRLELMGLTFQDITHPDDLHSDLAYVHRVLAGELRTYQLEKRYYRKDGRVVWVLLSVSLVRDAAGAPLYFISQVQDITDRKTAERDLQEAERSLETVLRTAYDAVVIRDGERILEATTDAAGMLGYRVDEVVGRAVTDFMDPAEFDAVLAARSMGQRPIRARARHRDGSTVEGTVCVAEVVREGRRVNLMAIRRTGGGA